MSRRRFHRVTTSLLVVLSLLFSQLALANYGCPFIAAEAEPEVMEMAPGVPCQGMAAAAGKEMDPNQPALCHQHCADAAQSFDPVQAPALSLPAVVQVLVMPLLRDTGAASESLSFERSVAERPPPDPLFLSTLRLRV